MLPHLPPAVSRHPRLHRLSILISPSSPPPPSSPSPPPPMGCNVRDRSIRGRRSRPSGKAPIAAAAPIPHPAADPDPNPNPNPNLDLNLHHPNPNPNPNGDAGSWGYCTEEQLEDLLLKNLDFVYNEAFSRLSSLGYDDAVALRAVLRNGHCYGSMDVLSNIVHNAVAYINSPPPPPTSSPPAPIPSFSDLRHLEEYSLAGMVCLLQQVRPHLTRGDAMWCLLMSDLHVGRASTIDIPSVPPPSAPEAVCRFHAGTAGDPSQCCPCRFDGPPSMKPLMKRNAKHPAPVSSSEEQQNVEDGTAILPVKDLDVMDTVMKSLESMTIGEDKAAEVPGEDHKKEMILDLVRQVRDLEGQVKERKEWAQQKAMQAARKLSTDLAELKQLRMEREENQRLKKGKQTLEESTMKRLSEMEAALKKASGQVDRANATVRQLETENAEIRAEMEASKLSASESAKTCQEASKREKKCLKRLQAWEKLRDKLLGEIADERRKISQMQQQLKEVQEAQKETEMKWRQEIKAKEQAISQVEEERRAKEAADVNIQRKHEAMRQKIEIDFQRHKDDIQRLEEELSHLKAMAGSTQLNNASNALSSGYNDVAKQPKEAKARIVTGSHKQQELPRKINHGRECIICTQDEVSVVLLPCAHQVICASCNEDHEKRTKTNCPCCNAQIKQRIRVYGASS